MIFFFRKKGDNSVSYRPCQTFGGAGGKCCQSLLFFFIFNILLGIDFFVLCQFSTENMD
ncbi:hypothetical protein QWZ16_13720 [Vibrio ostreicida]|uniref:Uncharacterized protein n=1 Tax=Vibrio ostreicida TaxID=526588 RepID=A0ABT8BWE4_9VIBR|nr:hypothetical protein [Vibrio ostreicida]MDN3610759.1 hypothetical protein [Vibrio ostreicida]